MLEQEMGFSLLLLRIINLVLNRLDIINNKRKKKEQGMPIIKGLK